jgi:hypothetical protein
MNNLSFGFIIILIIISLSIALIIPKIIKIRKMNRFSVPILVKNIITNVFLIIFSGIMYSFYEKFFNKIYLKGWPSVFSVIIVMIGMWFSNFIGITLSIIKIVKTYLIIITSTLFIVSTIITYNLINIIAKILEENKIISECSNILLIGILIIVENILSYIIAKRIVRIN